MTMENTTIERRMSPIKKTSNLAMFVFGGLPNLVNLPSSEEKNWVSIPLAELVQLPWVLLNGQEMTHKEG